MSKSILAKKLRLQTSIQLMPSSLDAYYDLFCDHGLVGLALSQLYKGSSIFWNDSNDVLLDVLVNKYDLTEESLLRGPAQELHFRSNSGIFLLGVGGHLMVRCLDEWQRHHIISSSQIYLFGPTYYQLSLREQLYKMKATLINRAFIWERGVGHELFLVKFKENGKEEDGKEDNSFDWKEFDSNFWAQRVTEDPGALSYLKKKNDSLKKNRNLKTWQNAYATSLGHFIGKFLP